MNVVEILIKAVTRDAERNIKQVDTTIGKIAKTAKSAGQAFKSMAATIGIASAILYGIGRAIDLVADRAAKLGDTRLSRSIENLKGEFQQLLDQILTTKIGDATIIDILNQGAQNLIPVVRALGVVLELAAGGFRDILIVSQRFQGVLDEIQGKTTQFTQEWYDASIALNHATTNARIGAIWEGNLGDTLEFVGRAAKNSAKAIKLQTDTVGKLKNAFKGLRQILDDMYAKEDAIREGDARALARLNRQATGGGIFGLAAQQTGGNNYLGGANQGNMHNTIIDDAAKMNTKPGPGGVNPSTIKPIINVYVDNGAGFKKGVHKVLHEDVFKPTVKAKSGGKKK